MLSLDTHCHLTPSIPDETVLTLRIEFFGFNPLAGDSQFTVLITRFNISVLDPVPVLTHSHLVTSHSQLVKIVAARLRNVKSWSS
ncbi:hypothetical protein N7468_001104 [Penicillium chermesinum]|uniref:Uncharacterized protein n=1 Tax=Penicillium chermesinum TaxID=63820 RepID=A0A9W9PG02_9EURO|nr:uncharacterized protein N7468_001104 [Penicillium chermesinum]KAJ5246121.1 hypothetical protein N7468_001104 [Penicillium chermesinum]KAJ6144408.1 hypothetical protein N7470_008303 [Penicillium chermesinum]